MKLFPIGTVSEGSNKGTISGATYSFFEPNVSCSSKKIYNVLINRFQNQTAMTRKVTDPSLQIEYSYGDIYNREYKAIENFVDSVDEALTSFLVVDLHNGQSPSSVASVTTTWQVGLESTSRYSAVTNSKANKVFLWDGVNNFKMGTVSNVIDNTTVSIDFNSSVFGAMSLSTAQSKAYAYPVYMAYLPPGAIDNFERTKFLDESITLGSDGGWMQTGKVQFISRYKV